MHDPEKKRARRIQVSCHSGQEAGVADRQTGWTEDKDMRNKRVIAYRQVR